MVCSTGLTVVIQQVCAAASSRVLVISKTATASSSRNSNLLKRSRLWMQPAWPWMMNKAQLHPTLAPGRSHGSVSRHRLTVCPGPPSPPPALEGLLVILWAPSCCSCLTLSRRALLGAYLATGTNASNAHTWASGRAGKVGVWHSPLM